MQEPEIENARLKALRDRYAVSLQTVLVSRFPQAPRIDVFSALCAIDPSDNKIHLKGIVRWFMAGAIRLDDLEATKVLVARHHRIRKRLPVGKRDLVDYGTPTELDAALGQFSIS